MENPSAPPRRPPRPVRPIRAPLAGWLRVVLGLLPVAVLVAAWTLATIGEPEERFVTYQILPSPGEVLSSAEPLWFEQGLARGVVQSLYRVFMGFLIGGGVALLLGILMAAFSTVRSVLNPFLVVGGYIPLPALVPLTLAWWGIAEKQKIGFLAIASLVYAWPLVVRSLDEVGDVFLQTAYTLGASRWQAIRKVLVPVGAAQVFDSLRLAFGVGWAYVILAEMIAAERGVGYLIYQAQRRNHPDQVYLLLMVIVLLAVVVDKGLEQVGRVAFPYRQAR